MTNTTAPPQSRVKMSIRVYRVDRHGSVTEDRGTVTTISYGEEPPLPTMAVKPPCKCPRCRAGQAVTE
jgi:hypothetical protein